MIVRKPVVTCPTLLCTVDTPWDSVSVAAIDSRTLGISKRNNHYYYYYKLLDETIEWAKCYIPFLGI